VEGHTKNGRRICIVQFLLNKLQVKAVFIMNNNKSNTNDKQDRKQELQLRRDWMYLVVDVETHDWLKGGLKRTRQN